MTLPREVDDVPEGSHPDDGGAIEDRYRDQQLFLELASLPVDDPHRTAVREEVLTRSLPLAEYLARKFRNRGEPLDDLIQVATIGLIKAVDRFDPARGVPFASFAAPTILGELKRHFRDHAWLVRVPRRLQELRAATTLAGTALTQDLGRSPTVAELATHLDATEDEIVEALEAGGAYAAHSLDREDADTRSLNDVLGDLDGNLSAVETRDALRPVLANLPERERRILMLRVFEERTQSQIASEIGISQMHVSRLLARSMAQIRAALSDA